MSETAERKKIEAVACYILDLPYGAEFTHSRVVNGDMRKYYYLNDEDGERYVYTCEKDQRFNEMMKAATKKHKKKIEEAASYIDVAPFGAILKHSRAVSGDIRKYYYLADEHGARYVYTCEKALQQDENDIKK